MWKKVYGGEDVGTNRHNPLDNEASCSQSVTFSDRL
jgi:hypothetical protein